MPTNAGGRAGDVLVLTKPLGAGVVATALKRGLASSELVERAIEGVLSPLADDRVVAGGSRRNRDGFVTWGADVPEALRRLVGGLAGRIRVD